MSNNIGFVITDIQEYTHNHLLDAINQYINDHPYDNVVVFNNTFNKLNINNKFYVLHISEAKYFDGILFMFNPTDASICTTFPGPKKQIFYASEIYWNTNPYIPYISWKNIFVDSDIEIITKSEQDYNIYSMCWKPPLFFDNAFTKETISNVVQRL